jgi:hypothetical protein
VTEKKEGGPTGDSDLFLSPHRSIVRPRDLLIYAEENGRPKCPPHVACCVSYVLHQGIRNEKCRAVTCEIEGQIVKMSCDASIAGPLLIKSLDGAAQPRLLPAAEAVDAWTTTLQRK